MSSYFFGLLYYRCVLWICSLNFIVFQCNLQATANSSADLSWLCSSLGGLTDDCAMSVQWEFEHKITSWSPQPKSWLVSSKTCALSTRLGSHLYVRSRVAAFVLAGHSMVLVHGWRHGQPTKKTHVASQHWFCLRQATIWAVDSRRWFCVWIFNAHSSHNR